MKIFWGNGIYMTMETNRQEMIEDEREKKKQEREPAMVKLRAL